jgi:hypothetical protein
MASSLPFKISDIRPSPSHTTVSLVLLLCLPLPVIRTPVIALGSPGPFGILAPSQGALIPPVLLLPFAV